VGNEAKDALAAIGRAVAWVRERREAGWPPLSPEYLARIERLESMPQNQTGADKTWVFEAAALDREHFERAERRH